MQSKHGADEDALFDRLYEALREGDAGSAKALRSRLTELGVDVNRILAAGQKEFNSFLAQQRTVQARARLDRVRKTLESMRAQTTESFDTIRDQLAQALAGATAGDVYVTFHRKLESLREEDVVSLRDDSALLDFLARMEAEDHGS